MRLDTLARITPGTQELRCHEAAMGLEVGGVCEDSRTVEVGDVYVAVNGTRVSGLDYVEAALAAGAIAVACEAADTERVPAGVPTIVVADARAASAQLASALEDWPQRALRSVGITGTNGKTTTAMIARQLLAEGTGDGGEQVGLLGTVGYDLCDRVVASRETTPGGARLVRYLATMRDAGATGVVMEVSSHALDQRRTAGLDFDVAALTNLTRDHLDYHQTLAAYEDAKAQLFESLLGRATAVLPRDLQVGRRMAERTSAHILWYGIGTGDVRAEPLELTARGTRVLLTFPDGQATLRLPLVGRYNVRNALAAAAIAWSLDVPVARIVDSLERADGVRGRLEAVDAGQPFPVLVDYAHTEDALDNVLGALRPLVRGRLVVVFGCGGDRDRGKRAPMGAVARRLADTVVVTSDNPRNEDPRAIIDDVASAFAPGDDVAFCVDRAQAIAAAFERASAADDLVLIAGKGHEDYQELAGGRRVAFDDVRVARDLLRARYPGVTA